MRFHRGGARRAFSSHGHPGWEDSELPSVSAHPMERESSRFAWSSRSLRRRGAENADFRGERTRPGFPRDRHHAHGTQLRSMSAVRRPYVSGSRSGPETNPFAVDDSHCVSRALNMVSDEDLRHAGERIEKLLEELRAMAGPSTW